MKSKLESAIFGPHHRWWALSVVSLATFMVTTDSGLLSISLPVIVTEFKTDLASGGLVPLIYALVTGSLYLPCGRLSDVVGRKNTLSAGFLIYAASSLVAGSSPSLGWLIFFRALQAVGSALMMANTFAVVTDLFPAAERGRAMGLSGGMIAALGFTVGPVLGGLLTYTMGWRSIYRVSAVVGVVGFLAARLILTETKEASLERMRREPFDFVGAAVFIVSLSALLLALTAGQKGLWHSPVVRGEFLLAALALAFFLRWEARARYPLLELGLFRIRPFAAGNVARLASFVALSMSNLIMPFFLQLAMAVNPLRAGLLMAAASIGLAVLSPLAGWLSDRIGATLLSCAGLIAMGGVFLSLAFLELRATPFEVAIKLGLLGIGMGLFQTPNNNLLMSSIPRDHLGVASSFLSIVRSLGLSLGVALAGAIVSARLIAATGQTSLENLGGTLAGSDALSAFMQGYRSVYLTATVLCFLGAVAAVPVGRQRAIYSDFTG
jgi:EmrB/QacA subfamily drug resistance transporter